MPGNFRKSDLRVIKTYKSLLSTLSKLLSKQNFNRLTVNDICEGAQLSRTTFYMHFLDKYDLLKYFLNEHKVEINNHLQSHDALNSFLNLNRRMIVNLIEDADYMTMEIVQEFIVSLLNILPSSKNLENNKHTVLANFCAGGIINCVLWQIKKSFPLDLQMANSYIEEIIMLLRKWGNE